MHFMPRERITPIPRNWAKPLIWDKSTPTTQPRHQVSDPITDWACRSEVSRLGKHRISGQVVLNTYRAAGGAGLAAGDGGTAAGAALVRHFRWKIGFDVEVEVDG